MKERITMAVNSKYSSRKNGKKVVRIRRNSMLNIGTFMFGILFIYMVICLFMYMTSSHITAYEVTAGPLSGNHRYTALALKSEKVVYSSEAGNITYYARENNKVGAKTGVYTIGRLDLNQKNTELNIEDLDASSFTKLKEIASNFSTNYSPITYHNVYNFKSDTQTTMLEILSGNAYGNAGTGSTAGLNLVPAVGDGIIVYSIDGMENLTIDDVTAEHFNRTNYKRENLRLNEKVNANTPVYKLITSEDWSLVIPLDRKTATELADSSMVRFTFMDDRSSFNADFTIVQNGNDYFGKLDISNSLIRYAGERFIDIELQINKRTGLKIPNTAIAEKSFYRIPKEFVIEDENSGDEIRLIKETYDKDGSAITKYMTATVYDKTDTDYYVNTALFEEGDYVLMQNSSKRFQVSDTKSLIGVYNINKGYAVFREITIIDENEEYCIVDSQDDYGLAQYDYIALDASIVKDDEIVVS